MIRWPSNALVFSVRVRACGVYRAGYVEGDTHGQEILAARKSGQGLELVVLRGLRQLPGPSELAAVRQLRAPGIAPILDAFIPLAALQPESVSSLGSHERVVLVEALPADVHVGDLVRRLFRNIDGSASPPVGLALRVVRDIAAVYAAAPAYPLPSDPTRVALHLARRASNVLLGWDGSIHIQPRVTPAPGHDDGGVTACGHHLVRLLSGEAPDSQSIEGGTLDFVMMARAEELPRELPSAVRALVRACVAREHEDLPGGVERSLPKLIEQLDALLADEPFSRADLAGVLAQLFADEREQDLAFREELGACDLDALTLTDVRALDASPENIAQL